MIIDLSKSKHKQDIEFDKGDILIFNNGTKYRYYLLVYDNTDSYYKIISLDTYDVRQKWTNLNNMIEYLNNPLNTDDFELVEILKPNQVILKRCCNE